MKKIIIVFLLSLITIHLWSQDQTVTGTLYQNLNNQWLYPAKIQIGRSNTSIFKDCAVIGVTDGNLHLDAYSSKALFLNYYQEGSEAGSKGITITPNGNVGIGTSNATQKLDVMGSQNLNGTLVINPITGYNYNEGIRIMPASNNWATIALGAIGDTGGNENMWSIHRKANNDFSIGRNNPEGINGMVITKDGKIGFGTENPQHKLDVNGTIRSKEVKIEATGWADFVFNKGYKLPTLQEVEQHINDKGHLPDIPSELEVKEKGISVGKMQIKLLQKIEELTLYVINLKKENEELQTRIKQLETNKL